MTSALCRDVHQSYFNEFFVRVELEEPTPVEMVDPTLSARAACKVVERLDVRFVCLLSSRVVLLYNSQEGAALRLSCERLEAAGNASSEEHWGPVHKLCRPQVHPP